MNEVHWTDPEFQEWERSQLGKYHEFETVMYGEQLKKFRHYRPDSHCLNNDFSPNYQNPIISLKDDGTVW